MTRVLFVLVSLFIFAYAQESALDVIKAGVRAYQENSLREQSVLIAKLENLAYKEHNKDAAFLLATAYKNKVLESSHKNNALKYYRLAAKENDHDAELMIGWLYYEGRVYLKADTAKAKYWFKKASDAGVIEATQMLNMLENL